jgi:endo-1,4-beta-xylanase
LRKTLEIVGLGVLTALIASGFLACSSSSKAGIILTVSTAPNVDRSAITALQVTVNGRTQSYALGTVSTWRLGIETSAGSKDIEVTGMAAAPVTDAWRGVVNALAGQVVYQDVELQALGTVPQDGGSGGAPGVDAPGSDSSAGTGGTPGRDGPIASGGVDGIGPAGGASGFGGMIGVGGLLGSGAALGAGGLPGTGGLSGAGGTPRTGAVPGVGGVPLTGGAPGTGGTIVGVGGTPGSGGLSRRGGVSGTGGTGAGGVPGTGGIVASGGTVSTGGSPGTGGTPDPCTATMPLSGGTAHSGNAQGTAAGLTWILWSNGASGTMTTYDTPAFSASWTPTSGDFLARLGLKWDGTKTYDQLGTLTAQFAEKKTGTAGGYSFIGVYGWSANPCVEYYIIDDSFSTMPVSLGGTSKGTAIIDGGTYTLASRAVTGTAIGTCAGTSSWTQLSSIRKTARQCGQISISEHFKAWNDVGMRLGNLDQAVILVEAGGGTGSIEFATARVMVQ